MAKNQTHRHQSGAVNCCRESWDTFNAYTPTYPIYVSGVDMGKHLIHEVPPGALQEHREQLLLLFRAGIFSAQLVSKTGFAVVEFHSQIDKPFMRFTKYRKTGVNKLHTVAP